MKFAWLQSFQNFHTFLFYLINPNINLLPILYVHYPLNQQSLSNFLFLSYFIDKFSLIFFTSLAIANNQISILSLFVLKRFNFRMHNQSFYFSTKKIKVKEKFQSIPLSIKFQSANLLSFFHYRITFINFPALIILTLPLEKLLFGLGGKKESDNFGLLFISFGSVKKAKN